MADTVKIMVGTDGVSLPGADLDVLTQESSTQLFPIGQRVCLSNGAVYRYAKAGEALTAGLVCSGPAVAADHDADLTLSAAAAAGAKTLTCRNGASTAITENMFQGGQFFVNDVTGEGTGFFIKSNTAASAGTANTTTIELMSPVKTALTTASQCGLVKNPYYGVLVYNKGGTENYPVGIPNIPVTSDYYFWLQTWGPSVAVSDAGVPVAGEGITVSTAVDGAVGTNLVAYPQIGICGPLTGVSTESIAIWLTIAP